MATETVNDASMLHQREYTPEQYRSILRGIAEQASRLHRIIMMAQHRPEEWELTSLIDAAESLSETIGAMADEASGCDVIGNAERWHYGPSFRREPTLNA